MNLINRMLVILQLLAAIALIPIAVVLLLFYRAPMVDAIAGSIRNVLTGANAVYSQAVCVGVAIFVFVVSVLLLFLELQRGGGRRLRLQVSEGHAELTEDAIDGRLEQAILRIADVAKVKSRVAARRKNLVDVMLEVETTPEVIVPKKTQEVITAVKQVMEEQLGLQVGKIQVRVDHPRQTKKAD
ncbi:hypothetical protein ANRL1_02054 [Anaerolineae bacterium]|nr:hypothetical protein ANRL1_02054 [Anaerolineae bacterium]